MQKVKIKNRKNQTIVVQEQLVTAQKGLAFIMHGLSGNKEQEHIVTMAQSFNEKNYSVILFDTTNTFGESDGDYKDATVTTYYQDLEDIINWARTQTWYQEPFYLAGHSLGGIAIILYAQNYPSLIKGLAPTSSVISGKLSYSIESRAESIKNWQSSGWNEEESKSVPGRKKRLPWSHMEDLLKYDALPNSHKLTMPTLLLVGDHDEVAPNAHQKLLFDLLPGKKEIHIIKGAPHTFIDKHHLKEIKEIFKRWIDKND